MSITAIRSSTFNQPLSTASIYEKDFLQLGQDLTSSNIPLRRGLTLDYERSCRNRPVALSPESSRRYEPHPFRLALDGGTPFLDKKGHPSSGKSSLTADGRC